MTDPHGAMCEALSKAFDDAWKKAHRPSRTGATSLDEAVAHHYTPKSKENDHVD